MRGAFSRFFNFSTRRRSLLSTKRPIFARPIFAGLLVVGGGIAAAGSSLVVGASEKTDQEQEVKSYDFILIGGGMASYMAFKELQSHAPNASIAIISDEPHAPYLRPPFSKNLWRDGADVDKLVFPSQDSSTDSAVMPIWSDPSISSPAQLLSHQVQGHVRQVDPQHKMVILEDGSRLAYGKLLIATGARPVSLSHIDENVRDRVMVVRTLEDFQRLHKAATTTTSTASPTITIVGGGYLGTELASSISKHTKCRVSQVVQRDHPMQDVFPEYLSAEVSSRLKTQGVNLIPRHSAVGVLQHPSDQKSCNVVLEDGSVHQSDYVVLALGVESDYNFLARSGLEIDDTRGGVVANSELQVRSDIWAAGDVVSYFDVTVGLRRRVPHVDHASMSGIVAAKNMLGAKKVYDYLPVEFGSVAGLDWEGCGLLDPKLDTISVWDESGQYQKGVVYYLEEGSIVGVLCFNLPEKMDYAKKLVQFGFPVEDQKECFNLIYLG